MSTSVQIRNFRWTDLDEYVALLNRISSQSHSSDVSSPGLVAEVLGQPNLHPEEDLFLAYQDSKLLGYWQNTLEPLLRRVIMGGGVDPAYRRQSIDALFLKRSLDYAQSKGYEIAHIPGLYVDLASRRLARGAGFRVVRRYWEMYLNDSSKVPPPKLPSGFALRPLAEGDQEALTELQNLAFSRHWGFSPNTVEEIRYRVHMSFSHPDGIPLITSNGKVVAYCWTQIEGSRGFIGMMGTDPQYRGRGLGETALRAGVAYLRDAGLKGVYLTVDSGNPSASKIYKAAGFRRRAVTLWYELRL